MTHPAAATQPVRFFHQGRIVEVTGVHPTRSVLDWLREDARCTGTKEGCNEGDCGACTVVIGELAPAAGAIDGGAATDVVGGLRLQTVNACIQFLPTLHGKALFTVEDLKGRAGRTDGPARGDSSHEKHPVQRLHPVQQAMVECHGSQCGFCTPGFVMSLWSTYERHQDAGTRPTRQELADDLSGNLCRCTGYRPILDAGQRMFDLPAAPLDTTAAVAALARLKAETDAAAATADDAAAGLRYAAARHGRTDTFHAPVTLDALAALRERLPTAQLLAGSTDVGLWVNKQFRDLGDIVYVGGVEEMKRIGERGAGEDAELYIGAGASLEDALRALVRRAPALADVWLRFASPPIRHAGTLGGNVANGSPIGDTPPVLMALDAEVELRRGSRVRRLRLDAFYLGYMVNRLEPGEFVQGIAVPLAALRRTVRAYKISKRFDCDISALCAGFAIAFEPAGGAGDTTGDPVVQAVRFAFGGMAATVSRAARAEAAVVGRPWTPATVAAAQAALAEDFKPLSDLRASAAYRLKVAQNLLQRLWLETRATEPLPGAAVSVWDAMPHALPAPVALTRSQP